jgi:hypothetical protein
MKQKIIPALFSLLLTTGSLSIFMPATVGEPSLPPTPCFPGGTGTPGDPYWIANVSDLQNMSTDLAASYKLINDIDASATATWNWNGTAYNGFEPVGWYNGIFDGKGYHISNLHINRPVTDYVGLFEAANPSSVIKNVSMVNCSVIGHDLVGALVGDLDAKVTNCSSSGYVGGHQSIGGLIGANSGDIFFCHSYVNVSSDYNAAGGLVGYVHDIGRVSWCYATGHVVGDLSVGGIVGRHQGQSINESYATGDVQGGSYVGGHTGRTHSFLTDCYSTGDVTGNSRVGGFIGYCDGPVNRSYSTGSVSGSSFIGGFCGDNTTGIFNSFWDNETSGWTSSAGEDTGAVTGLNTSDMMNDFTFTNVSWDFNTVWWSVKASTRPFLRMEWDSEISNSHQVQLMQMNLAEDYTLINDIDMSDITEPSQMWGTSTTSGIGFLPVGNDTVRFTGNLNGNNHSIYSLFINRPSESYVGLLGSSDTSPHIDNLCLEDYEVHGQSWIGALVGMNRGTISNCHGNGNVSGPNHVGGLIGFNHGSVMKSSTDGDLSWGGYLGGFVGGNAGSITDCHSFASCSGGTYVGSFAGSSSGTITNCTSHGNASGQMIVGGLIGFKNLGTVTECKAYGVIDATGDYVGGLIGQHLGGDVYSSTAYGDIIAWDQQAGGLMGYNGVGSSVCNCTAHGNITGTGHYRGGLIGRNVGTVENCTALGNVGDNGGWIGGLVGDNFGSASLVTNSSAYGNVHGSSHVGGLIGMNVGVVNTSFSMGIVNGSSNNCGGLVGMNNNGTVENCYSQGEVNGNGRVGGLVGNSSTYFGGGIIINCYSSGAVSGNSEVGGLIGRDNTSNVNSCFWDNGTSGWTTSAGGTGITTSEMMQQATFDPPWDFTSIWGIFEHNTYPFLWPTGIIPTVDADVGITIWDSTDPIMPGDTFNYSFEVTNYGPVNALDVQAVINLPWTVDYVSNNQSALVADKNITWDIGLLLSGEKAWLGVRAAENGTSGTLITCWANVTATTPDSDGSNDMSFESTTINYPPNAGDDSFNVAEDSGPNVLDVLADDNDPDNDNITIISVTQGANGTAVIIDSGNNLTYEPNADYTGPDSFTYTIDDGLGGTDTATVDITVVNVNDAPEITTTDVTTATEDVPYSVDYEATDIDPSDTLTWDLETDAGWLDINTNSGVLSGTPDNDDVGSYWVNVTVDDGNGGSDSSYFTLTVVNNNDGPVISTTTAPDGIEGQPYSHQVNATDVDGDSLTWSRTTNASWLIINVTGMLSGTPTSAGAFWVRVTVNDGHGGADMVNLTFSIAPDTDGDGIPDGTDTDDDGDGVSDTNDDFPTDASETTDTDVDGIGNNADTDDDGDGVDDSEDAFPLDAAETTDTDGDGIGNNADTDDDGDGILDVDDENPLIPDEGGGFPVMILVIIIIVIVAVVGVVANLKMSAGKGGGKAPKFEEPAEEITPAETSK